MHDVFTHGTLPNLVTKAVEIGYQSGALIPIATDLMVVHEHGLSFPVRVLGHFDKKLKDPTSTAKTGNTNPFLPYDPNLFVANISQSHVCLLNKYPIIEGHLLIVTRDFEHQETLISYQDFLAAWRCLVEFDGVVFYNSGPVAGASQPHKHIQLIPHPPEKEAETLPIPQLFKTGLPFRAGYHAYPRVQEHLDETFIRRLHERYLELLVSLALISSKVSEETPKPYNLLMTREFIMIVPRRAECVEEMSINAMGFMGSLFVRDQDQLDRIVSHGIIRALQNAAGESIG